MRIAIIGSGSVGQALARGWATNHAVTFGVRDPGAARLQSLLSELVGARAAPVAEAAAAAEVVVLAVPWEATREVLESIGGASGKILLDCTNPLEPDLSGLLLGHRESGGERIAVLAPGARVVKIFNSTGANNMVNPRYGSSSATMFHCGDDLEAKRVARMLAQELGFDAIDAGPLTSARLLEPLAMLWIHLAYVQQEGREIAFKLLRRSSP